MSAPARKSIELFYDCVSPYSWIAFEVLCRYQTKWQVDLKLKPFFLGGIMKETGNRPPAMLPAKAIYLMHDLARLSKHYNIPLKPNTNFMEFIAGKGTMPTMRFVTAVDMKQPQLTEELSRQMWVRFWSEDKADIGDADGIKEAAKKAGLSDAVINDALSNMGSDGVKSRLKQYTQEALEHGSFGAPTIVVTDAQGRKHMVFGSDRIHIVADLLGEKYVGPLSELSKL